MPKCPAQNVFSGWSWGIPSAQPETVFWLVFEGISLWVNDGHIPSISLVCCLVYDVQKSSGQFIYATTVMRYLEAPDYHPTRWLDHIMTSVDSDIPYQELDALYSQIFSHVEDLATTLKIFGFLFLRYLDAIAEPLTLDFLAHLLGLKEEDVHFCLYELHLVVDVPPPRSSGLDSEIKVLHASLHDYLLDKQ
ncbi:hypothetical protein BYT27DRAFT_7248509 [Phlegmacium glaucopus]|nr:hypothetical protein BYT27DRAFT_7248509 [Phlegmacium glaucopus]